MNQKPYQWLAWIGTIGVIGCALMASFNLYPYYNWGFLFFNLLWIIIGILWREKSLITMSLVVTLIYAIGLIYSTPQICN